MNVCTDRQIGDGWMDPMMVCQIENGFMFVKTDDRKIDNE